MKTNRILTAAALPLFFAACSQETLLDESVVANDYSNIPTVDVEFSASTSAGSRMGTQWGWEVGDRVGIAWLGGGESDLNEDGKAYQNNILTCIDTKASAFKSEGMLYVGNYFAYMPYSEETTTVTYIPFTVKEQELTTNPNDVAKRAIYITPKITELVKEAENASEQEAGVGKNVKLYLSKLSNAVTFNVNFKNNKYTDLKVTDIALSVENMPTGFKYNPIAKNAPSVGEWAEADVNKFFGSCGANGLNIGNVTFSSEEGLSVVDNKLTTYGMILPSRKPQNHIYVRVTTNYGYIEINSSDKKVSVAGYESNWTQAPIFKKFGQTGTINLTVDADNFKFTSAQTTVSNQAELEDLLNRIATSGKKDPITITVNSKVTDFKLKDFTLPEGLKSDITLTTDNNIFFDGTNVINKNLELSATNVNITSGTLTVKEDQTFTVDKSGSVTTIAAGATLVNNGTIDLNSNYVINGESEDKTKPAGLYISNNENATISGYSIKNDGEIKWIAGTLGTFTSTNTWGNVFAEVKNFNDIEAISETNVNTLRFVEATEFSNENADFTIKNNITTVEVLAPVTINIQRHSIKGATTVAFANKVNVNIAKDASLTVNSDFAENKFTLPYYRDKSTIKVNKGAELYMNNLDLSSSLYLEINNEGKVSLIDVKKPDGLKYTGSSTVQN